MFDCLAVEGWQASALLPRLTIAITFVLVCLFVCLLLIFCLLFLNFLNCLFAFFFKIHRQGLDCADDPNWDLFFSCFLLLVVFLFVFLLFVCNTNVERSEILHVYFVDIFQISPRDSCGEFQISPHLSSGEIPPHYRCF